MDFPILEVVDDQRSESWLERHFHPQGLHCPHCGAGTETAFVFRQTKCSGLTVYRCQCCQGIYNLYSGTVFAGRHLRPAQVVLLLQGVCQGKSAAQLARELQLSRTTTTDLRHRLQANAVQIQANTPLPDLEAEADELFQNAGEKRRTTS
jgi:transposase-like protein